MGMALRIYDKETTGNLKIISNIRNAFAHSKRLIAFEHDLVEKEIRKVSVPKFQKRAHREIRAMKYGAKGGYVTLCILISTYLTNRYVESLKAKTKRLSKKRRTSFYEALIGSLDKNALRSNRLLSPQNQSGGPNPLTPLGSLFAPSSVPDPTNPFAHRDGGKPDKK